MILSDVDLLDAIADGSLVIDPFDESRLQPSSIDLTMDSRVKVLLGSPRSEMVDPREDNSDLMQSVVLDEAFDLQPGTFALASTAEVVKISNRHVGRVEGKSSLARLGLLVHATAGYIDPGFHGQITLELSNLLPMAIKLYAGMPIAQLAVMQMTSPARHPYAGKYQGQSGPQQSRYHLNFRD